MMILRTLKKKISLLKLLCCVMIFIVSNHSVLSIYLRAIAYLLTRPHLLCLLYSHNLLRYNGQNLDIDSIEFVKTDPRTGAANIVKSYLIVN